MSTAPLASSCTAASHVFVFASAIPHPSDVFARPSSPQRLRHQGLLSPLIPCPHRHPPSIFTDPFLFSHHLSPSPPPSPTSYALFLLRPRPPLLPAPSPTDPPRYLLPFLPHPQCLRCSIGQALLSQLTPKPIDLVLEASLFRSLALSLPLIFCGSVIWITVAVLSYLRETRLWPRI